LPYSMIEPLREVLDAGVQSDVDDSDERWQKSLRDEIMGAVINLNAKLLETELSLKELSELKAGDILPVEMPETVLITANEIPTFRGKMGSANGNLALEIVEIIEKPDLDSGKGSRLAFLREQIMKEREEDERIKKENGQ